MIAFDLPFLYRMHDFYPRPLLGCNRRKDIPSENSQRLHDIIRSRHFYGFFAVVDAEFRVENRAVIADRSL